MLKVKRKSLKKPSFSRKKIVDFSIRKQQSLQEKAVDILGDITTPSFVIDESVLDRNGQLMKMIQDQTGCDIILALKAFSSFTSFPTLIPYLKGSTASSLYEARLAYEEFGKEVHVYSPGYVEHEFDELLSYSDHLNFNSISQLTKFASRVKDAGKQLGLRLNPEYSEVKTMLYDPCQPFSRFGVTKAEFDDAVIPLLDGIHFHCLCGLNADTLERTLYHLEQNFEHVLHHVKWVNFGGGHTITAPDYNVDLLCQLIINFQKKYDVKVILEPGEGVVYQAGYLVAEVLDIMHNNINIAVLNTSATTHMPDILEMPYRPNIANAGQPNEFDYTYRLTGMTCLSGDIIGDFSFTKPLEIGQKLVFFDMAQYSIVKTTHFNGVPLPSLAKVTKDGELKMVKTFGYETFKSRLS